MTALREDLAEADFVCANEVGCAAAADTCPAPSPGYRWLQDSLRLWGTAVAMQSKWEGRIVSVVRDQRW